MKRFIKVVVLCSGLLITMPYAMEDTNKENITYDNQKIVEGLGDIELRSSNLVVDASITSGGVSWTSFAKPNARIYVNNTTGENMSIILSKNGFQYDSFVATPGGNTFVCNRIGRGHFSLDFSSDSGRVSGNVAVRISDEYF